jgi:hypothetical protein
MGKTRVIPRGSVHAGLLAVHCPSRVPERQPPTAPERGRDARVTTQVTTQIAVPAFRDVPAKSSEGGVVHSTPAFPCGGAGGLCKQDREWLQSSSIEAGQESGTPRWSAA